MATTKINNKKDLFGGIKAGNLDKIDTKFICGLCTLVLFLPWQLLCCGVLLCGWCLKRGLSNRYVYRVEFNSNT